MEGEQIEMVSIRLPIGAQVNLDVSFKINPEFYKGCRRIGHVKEHCRAARTGHPAEAATSAGGNTAHNPEGGGERGRLRNSLSGLRQGTRTIKHGEKLRRPEIEGHKGTTTILLSGKVIPTSRAKVLV